MVYKKAVALLFVLGVGSDSYSMESSLKVLVADRVLADPELQKGLEKVVPEEVRIDVARAYCEENLSAAWERLSEKTVLQQGRIQGLAFIGTSAIAVSADSHGVLRWWDTAHVAQNPGPVRPLLKQDSGQGSIIALAVSKEGEYMVTAGGSTVKLWAPFDGKEITSFEFEEPICSVALNTAATHFVAGSTLGSVYVVDITKRTRVLEFVHARLPEDLVSLNRVYAVGFSLDGTKIYSACRLPENSALKTIKVWDAEGSCVKDITLECKHILGKMVFIGDRALTSFTGGSVVETDLCAGTSTTFALGENGKSGIESSMMSPDGRFLLTASQDGMTRIWERKGQSYEIIREFQGGRLLGKQLVFRSDGYMFLSGGPRGLDLWSTYGPNALNKKPKTEEAPEATQERALIPLNVLLARINERIRGGIGQEF